MSATASRFALPHVARVGSLLVRAYWWCSAVYHWLAARGLHFWVFAGAAASILLLPVGVISSAALIAVIYLGSATLLFDRPTCRDLGPWGDLFPLSVLLGLVVFWQLLGLALREPFDPDSPDALVSAVAIALLLPGVAAMVHHEPRAPDWLLAVVFGLGCVAAAISLAVHVLSGEPSLSDVLSRRLEPIGRAHHAILGAGGLASTLFAGAALVAAGRLRLRSALPALALIALAIALTQSRGPVTALCFALAATALTLRVGGKRGSALALILLLLCYAIPVTLVLAEPWIKGLVCATESGLCRPSARQNVWAEVLGLIPERPWIGIGPGFRFPEDRVNHAHNGLLGLGFFFGVPVVLLFGGIAAAALTVALHTTPAPRFYALASLFFSAAFTATDLANPFAFINTHYLFLWLPALLGAAAAAVLRTDPLGAHLAAPRPDRPVDHYRKASGT